MYQLSKGQGGEADLPSEPTCRPLAHPETAPYFALFFRTSWNKQIDLRNTDQGRRSAEAARRLGPPCRLSLGREESIVINLSSTLSHVAPHRVVGHLRKTHMNLPGSLGLASKDGCPSGLWSSCDQLSWGPFQARLCSHARVQIPYHPRNTLFCCGIMCTNQLLVYCSRLSWCPWAQPRTRKGHSRICIALSYSPPLLCIKVPSSRE